MATPPSNALLSMVGAVRCVASAVAASGPVDVPPTDLRMPVMDGIGGDPAADETAVETVVWGPPDSCELHGSGDRIVSHRVV